MGQASVWIAPQTMVGAETSYKPSFDGLKTSRDFVALAHFGRLLFQEAPDGFTGPAGERVMALQSTLQGMPVRS